jgi:mannosyl-3-phosphoglycerate synthase
LLPHITGFETEVVKTANSDEHAFSMALVECLHFSGGYSVEPHEFLDILEKIGGLLPQSGYSEIREKGIEIFQIEPRNPHFHEDKGSAHLKEMLEASLISLSRSEICQVHLSQEINNQIKKLLLRQSPYSQFIDNDKTLNAERRKLPSKNPGFPLMSPIKPIPINAFAKGLNEYPASFLRYKSPVLN